MFAAALALAFMTSGVIADVTDISTPLGTCLEVTTTSLNVRDSRKSTLSLNNFELIKFRTPDFL